MQIIVFEQKGTFEAKHAAEQWCQEPVHTSTTRELSHQAAVARPASFEPLVEKVKRLAANNRSLGGTPEAGRPSKREVFPMDDEWDGSHL